MTPAMPCSSLSRARSVPLPATAEEADEELVRPTPPAQQSLDKGTEEAKTRATGSFTTTHYTVVATDCRRSALLMSGGANFQYIRRGSGLSYAQTSSAGSFGGNDADHEDNIDEEDETKQPIITVEGNFLSFGNLFEV